MFPGEEPLARCPKKAIQLTRSYFCDGVVLWSITWTSSSLICTQAENFAATPKDHQNSLRRLTEGVDSFEHLPKSCACFGSLTTFIESWWGGEKKACKTEQCLHLRKTKRNRRKEFKWTHFWWSENQERISRPWIVKMLRTRSMQDSQSLTLASLGALQNWNDYKEWELSWVKTA